MIQKINYIDAYEYISTLKDLVKKGKSVNFTISGNSMSPFLIHERDSVVLSPIEQELKEGDIVFYERNNNAFVLHRIVKIQDDGYYMLGDAQKYKYIEGPIFPNQIFAVVTKAYRGGITLKPGDKWWDFFATTWAKHIRLRWFYRGIYILTHSGLF